MTSTTEQAAVAVRDNSPSGLITEYKADFAAVLPSHIKPDTWLRLAVGALRRDKKVAQAAANNPAALMGALLTAARLGLEPGTEQFYLTPRGVKGQDGRYHDEILGIVGYQGEIELMYRAGAISSVIVEVVRDNDRFSYAPGRDERPQHDIDWDAKDRGDLRLVYAYAVMKDGATSKVVVLNTSHIEAAKANSKGSDKPYSPWQQHTEAMWLKTAAHRLAKWVPTSAEYMREQLRAVQDVQAEQRPQALLTAPLPQPIVHTDDAGPVDADTGEVIHAEIVEDETGGADPDGDVSWPKARKPADA